MNIALLLLSLAGLLVAINIWYTRRDRPSRELVGYTVAIGLFNLWSYFGYKFISDAPIVVVFVRVVTFILVILFVYRLFVTLRKV